MNSPETVRLFLLDDNELLLEGLKDYLSEFPDQLFNVEIDGITTPKIPDIFLTLKDSEIDILLLDLLLPGYSGFDLMEHMHKYKLRTKLLVYSGFCYVDIVLKSKILGAHGFVNKGMIPNLIDAIICVHRGETYFPDLNGSELIPDRNEFYTGFEYCSIIRRLTKRELRVLLHVGMGYSIAQMEKLICVDRKTIDFHLSNIRYKLHCSHQAELSKIADRFVAIHNISEKHRCEQLKTGYSG